MSSSPSRIFAPGALTGRVALVTGGGTGLGLAAARELAACSASVVLSGRREAVLDEAVQAIGGDAIRVAGDVRVPEDAERMVDAAVERFGRLDVLVNNAGGQYFTPAEGITPKGWRAVTGLNVGGTELMTRVAVERAMGAAAGGAGGTVIDVTLSPHHGLAGMTHSSAARAAVEGYVRAQADRWAEQRIAVIAIAAGHYDTASLRKYPESVWRSAARTVPLGRLGREEEHAWLVALAASSFGAHLSGAVLTLDGARDNWFGPWPPGELADPAGEVPTEARRPAPEP